MINIYWINNLVYVEHHGKTYIYDEDSIIKFHGFPAMKLKLKL